MVIQRMDKPGRIEMDLEWDPDLQTMSRHQSPTYWKTTHLSEPASKEGSDLQKEGPRRPGQLGSYVELHR